MMRCVAFKNYNFCFLPFVVISPLLSFFFFFFFFCGNCVRVRHFFYVPRYILITFDGFADNVPEACRVQE